MRTARPCARSPQVPQGPLGRVVMDVRLRRIARLFGDVCWEAGGRPTERDGPSSSGQVGVSKSARVGSRTSSVLGASAQVGPMWCRTGFCAQIVTQIATAPRGAAPRTRRLAARAATGAPVTCPLLSAGQSVARRLHRQGLQGVGTIEVAPADRVRTAGASEKVANATAPQLRACRITHTGCPRGTAGLFG
jgi:hypothetical protein